MIGTSGHKAAAEPRVDEVGAVVGTSVQIGYADRLVIDGVDIAIETGTVTTLIGPNGSGKSTLLKGCSRLLSLRGGSVFIDGLDIHRRSSRDVARPLAVLPQSATAPSNLTVRELVEQGRYPHVGALRMLGKRDASIIDDALAVTGLTEHANNDVDALSGGERQRAWIALALAQQTQTLLLDEPTTFLDISFQLEVLELIRNLNHERGVTVVMVLHDLNQAAAYSDRIVCMKHGALVADGQPADVITADLLRDVFRVEATVMSSPQSGTPVFFAHRAL